MRNEFELLLAVDQEDFDDNDDDEHEHERTIKSQPMINPHSAFENSAIRNPQLRIPHLA